MKIQHIIPTAFDYFKDIEALAFATVEKLSARGIESEIATIQYAAPTAKERAVIRGQAPSRQYIGSVDFSEAAEEFKEFDLVHVHCPLFGAAGRILSWKKANPRVPLVVTYYRDARIEDFFSVFIRFYNSYYLPRLFAAAEAVACFSTAVFYKGLGGKYLRESGKLVDLYRGATDIHLTKGEDRVELPNEAIIGLEALYKRLAG